MTEGRGSALPQSIDAHLQQILAAYRSAVPSIDAGPIQLFGRLGAITRLYRAFTDRCLASHGVTHPQYQALGLMRAGIASSASELAFYLRWGQDSAEDVVQSLERAELLERAATEDGRSPGLSLTRKGVQVADESLREISSAQAQALKGLGDADLRELQGALDELIGRLAFLDPG
jgi:DNA-binding MarR family transcriptional regulator